MTRATVSDRHQIAKLAANESWAQTEDWSARTAPARAAFLTKLERDIDPEGTMDPELRAKRVEAKRRAYFQRLAYQSAKARRARSAGNGVGDG